MKLTSPKNVISDNRLHLQVSLLFNFSSAVICLLCSANNYYGITSQLVSPINSAFHVFILCSF